MDIFSESYDKNNQINLYFISEPHYSKVVLTLIYYYLEILIR